MVPDRFNIIYLALWKGGNVNKRPNISAKPPVFRHRIAQRGVWILVITNDFTRRLSSHWGGCRRGFRFGRGSGGGRRRKRCCWCRLGRGLARSRAHGIIVDLSPSSLRHLRTHERPGGRVSGDLCSSSASSLAEGAQLCPSSVLQSYFEQLVGRPACSRRLPPQRPTQRRARRGGCGWRCSAVEASRGSPAT